MLFLKLLFWGDAYIGVILDDWFVSYWVHHMIIANPAPSSIPTPLLHFNVVLWIDVPHAVVCPL